MADASPATPPSRRPANLLRQLTLSMKPAQPTPAPDARSRSQKSRLPLSKRLFDLSLLLALAPLWLPAFLFMVAWSAILGEGQMFYRQTRVGLDQRRFTLFKFKTMKSGNIGISNRSHLKRAIQAGLPLQKLDELGERNLLFGARVLRAIGFDELPQLLNILRGDMSFVGPRPCLPEESSFFQDIEQRFHVAPGLTGDWQVSGKNDLTFEEMMTCDARYAERNSIFGDLAILLRTPWVLCTQALKSFSPQQHRTQALHFPKEDVQKAA